MSEVRDTNSQIYIESFNAAPSTSTAGLKKRKLNAPSSSTVIDSVIEKTVQTLSVLQENFAANKAIQDDVSGNFARYIENELRYIDDEEILTDVKFEIASII
ncbi:hypothetical protein QE152_g23027 [Popillia japonica]|uniref:Uncharacterized protein n=1 Tax=Popillia japonica TaxID=7064 RepID=A0AAW1KJ17_POPJA